VLKSVTKGDVVVSYITDPVGRRIGKKINSVLKEGFVYKDQLNPIAKLDSLGNVVQTYIYLEKFHVPSFMEFDGKVYRLITDHLGSVVAVMDVETGVLIQEVSYDAFGNIVSDTNPGFQPFGFAGGLYDNDTKLLRFGARDYNPVAGRWMQKDLIGFAGGDTNLYRYVGNDPVNFVDPMGTYRFSPGGYGAPVESLSSDYFGNKGKGVRKYVRDVNRMVKDRVGSGSAYDPIRHCTGSCAAATFYGKTAANLGGLAREFTSRPPFLVNSPSGALGDILNNYTGANQSDYVNRNSDRSVESQCLDSCCQEYGRGNL